MMSLYVITAWLASITAFCVGILVYSKNPKRDVNKRWVLLSLSITFWSLFLGFLFKSADARSGLIYAKVLMVGANFIPVFFYHFVLALLGQQEDKKARRLLSLGYGITCFLIVINFTPLFIRSVSYKGLVKCFYPDAGPLLFIYIVMYFWFLGYSCFLMYVATRTSLGFRKNRIRYVMLASMVGFLGGATTFPLWYQIPIPPFGSHFVWLYAVTVTIAIIKYHLMDVRVAITRAGIFAIVYALVLGIPIGLMGWGKPWLYPFFGSNWHWSPLILAIILATLGPFIYLYLQQRTEEALLKEQRQYQTALRELSRSMTRIHGVNDLFQAIGTTVVDIGKIPYVAMYLKDNEYKSFKRRFVYPGENHSRFKEFISLDHPVVELLCQRKKVLLSEEVGEIDRKELDFSLIVPCFMDDNLLAFIVLGPKPNNEMYTQDDLIVFETLSYSTALSIENCFFWQEIEDRQRKARIQEMDTFSYSLAHEVDNPMAIILGNSDLLKIIVQGSGINEGERQEIFHYLDYIFEAATRVSAMVKAIYDYGKKDTGEYYYLTIQEAVEGFVQLYMPQFKNKSIMITKDIPHEPIFIYGEKQELIQVFINFAKNSIHALQDTKDKKIIIKVEKVNEDILRVTFSDTGYGIPADKIPIVFAPFVTTKASSEGSGMGLYFVKRIIDRHKGKVRVESDGTNGGTSIIIEMPIAKGIKEDDIRKQQEGRKSRRKF